ncbi:MAG TPA: tetratricopeptide repeat protein [Sumerlaeia bacterium]|nr:tetratricopeptide repeat protein [Sumerlaeia bacterium]
MLCPFCRTENRDERDTCYNCEKDLSMLRLLVNKARSHFNTALEFAERDRTEEAIAELQNALDLDRSHVNSHIVLGTLHAKSGQIDKAEAAWREAMRTDPRFEKAHEYLVKIDTARRKLPVVRRQRLIIITMVAVLVMLAYLLFTQNQPDPNPQRLENAWQAYTAQNYEQTLDILARILAEGGGSHAAAYASVLRDVIQAEQRTHVESAQKHLDFLELERAYRQAANLLARRPSKPVRAQARAIQAKAVAAARRSLTETIEAFRDGEATREQAEAAVALCRAVQGSERGDDFLAGAEKELADLVCAYRVEEILEELEREKADLWTRLEALAALRGEFPGHGEIQSLIDRAVETPARKSRQQAEEHIAAGRIEEAEASIQTLKRMLDAADPAKTGAVIEPLAQELKGKKTALLTQAVRKAYASNDLEKTIALGEELLDAETHAIDETTRVAVEDMALQANRRLAHRHWDWMVKRGDWRYQQGLIDAEEAEKTIRYFPRVDKYLSRKVFPSSQDNLLFYLASAHAKLGHEEQAVEIFKRIKEEYPESNLIDWVDRQLEKAPGQ